MTTTASRLYINGFEPGVFTLRSPTNGNLAIQSTTVRSGSYAARLQAVSGTATTYQMDLATATYSQVICRFYLYIATNPTATRTLCGTGSLFSSGHSFIGLTSAGKLCLMTGSTVQSTGSTTLTTGAWHRVEWRINMAQQTHLVRLDGSDEISAVTCQFAAGGNASISTLYLGCADVAASSADLYFDDIVVDESDWVGDSKIVALAPASVSATSGGAFSVSGAASTAAALADWTNDTSYAISGNSGAETYTLASLPGDLVSPRGVVVHCREKTGSGSMIFQYGLTDGLASALSSGAFSDASFTWRDFFQYSGTTYGPATSNGITQSFLYGNWTLDRIQSLKLKLSSSSANTGNFSGLLIQLEYVTSGSDPTQRVWLEGFEHTDLQDLTVTGTAAVSSTQAHGGSKSLRVNPTGSTASYAATSSTIAGGDSFIRAYVYVNAYPTSGNTCRLFSAVSFGSMSLAVRMDNAGHLRLEDASGLLGSAYSTAAIALNTWARVEVHLHQSSSSSLSNGAGELRLDGTSLQTASIKTNNNYAAYTLRLGTDLAPGSGGCDFFLDDIAVDANTWPGAGTVAELLPSGSGSGDAASWSVTGAATHWQALADSVPDGATSYVGTSTTNGSYETYTQDDLPSGATSVAGAMLVFTAAMAASATSLSVLPAASASGIIPTIYSSTVSSTSYATFRHRVPWSPTTGNWSPTSVNASYLKVQLGNATAANVSSARLLVDYTGAVTNTKETTANAIVQATNVKETSASAIVQTTNTSQLTADALVTVTNVKETTADAVLQAANTKEATASALVQTTDASQATADAVLQATETSQTTADGVLLATQTLEATTDGYVYSASTPTSEVTADALLAQGTTSQTTADGVLQATQAAQTSADAVVQATETSELSVGAVIFAGDEASQASADALVAQTTTSETTADAQLVLTSLLETTADAHVVGPAYLELAASALVKTSKTLEVTASAALVQTNLKQVASDATIAATDLLEVTAGGYVSLSTGKTFEITGDAVVYPSLTDQFKTLYTDAWLVDTASVTKSVSVSATGRVVLGYPEVSADAFVQLPTSALRAVSTSASDLLTLSSYHLAVGERTDGASFINVAYVIPNSFALANDVTATGIGFAVDLKTRVGGEIYTLQLLQGTTVVAQTSFDAGALAGAALSTSTVGWYMTPLSPGCLLTAGTLYSVKISGSGALNVLATRNIAGFDGFFGSVVNSFVITSDTPSTLSGRPLSLLAQVGATPPSATVSASATLSDLTIGPGASLTLDASQSVTLTIQNRLLLCGKGQLTSTPASGKAHTLACASGASLALHGGLALTGQAKTRFTYANADAASTATALTLTDAPSGWLAGDQIWVSNHQSGDGKILTLASLGATAVFTTNLGQDVKQGALIVNLSRSVTLTGAGPTDRAAVTIGQSASLALNHVTWRCLGATQSFPGSYANGSANDLVICEGRLEGSVTGASAGVFAASLALTDLTIARLASGMSVTADLTHAGTLLACDIYAQNSAITVKSPSYRNATLRASVIAAGIAGAAVTLDYLGNFIGSATNLWAHSDGALVACTGAAQRVELTGGTLSTSLADSAGNSAAIWIWEGGSLGRFRGANLLADSPWVYIVDGFLGDGEVTGSTSSFTSDWLVQCWANNAKGIPPFVRFSDDQGLNFTPYDDMDQRAGSRIANQIRTVETDGVLARSADSHSGNYALQATSQTLNAAYQDQVNFGLRTELDRITLLSGQTCTLQAYCKGAGTLHLGSSSQVVSNSAYAAVTISYTAAHDEVILFELEVTGTQSLLIDDVSRLA